MLGADLDKSEQAQDGRQLDAKAYAVYLSLVLLDNFHFSGEQQSKRLLPVNDLERLVSCVQK